MLYLEDFQVGQVIEIGPRTVTEAEIIEFANEFDPQFFHVDPAAAKRSPFGGLIASGWHTAAMTMRMLFDAYISKAASLGSPGIDELRWLKPVRPGDSLRLKGKVVEVRPSQSKPDRGLLRIAYELYNQNDEVVMTMRGMGMYRRRPQAA